MVVPGGSAEREKTRLKTFRMRARAPPPVCQRRHTDHTDAQKTHAMQNYTEENTWNSTPSVARADMDGNAPRLVQGEPDMIPRDVHMASMDPLPAILQMPEMTDDQLEEMKKRAQEWARWMLNTTDEDARVLQFARMNRLDRKFIHDALVDIREKNVYRRPEE